MKKIFIAFSVLAVFLFSLAPVQANVLGARDIAPGSEFNVYFLVSAQRVLLGSGPSTVLKIQETKGKGTKGSDWSNLHFNFYTINSSWVHDLKFRITRWATVLKDIGKMIQEMSPNERLALGVKFRGQDYYAGYIVATEIQYRTADNILADVYQLSLNEGRAAKSNVLVKGAMAGGVNQGIPALIGTAHLAGAGQPYEVFSGHAMAAATDRILAGATNQRAGWAALYPQYHINDSSGRTDWIIHRGSIPKSSGLLEFLTFHTWVINGAEVYRSTTVKIRELSILDAASIIPSVLLVAYPYIGQVNLRIPGDIDPASQKPVPSDSYLDLMIVGWNRVLANSAVGSLNWEGMANMGFDASSLPIGGYNPTH